MGVIVKCILDPGSMGATISVGLLPAELSGSVPVLALVRDASGLEIPYLGYLEPDVEVLGCVIPTWGILVVKDPPERVTSTH